MELKKFGKIKKSTYRKPLEFHQTGFASPATHYAEPSIDLNRELIGNKNATFFLRAGSNEFSVFGIEKDDVLIVDRSLSPKAGSLALVVKEGEFELTRIKGNDAVVCELWGIVTYLIHLV